MKNNKKSDLYLFYLPTFEGGGSETVIINIANDFYKKKLNVVFLCSNISGSLYFKLNKKIKLINLKKKRFLTSIIPLIIKIRLLKPNVIFSTLLHVNLMLCFFKIFLNKDAFLVIRHGNLMVVTNNFIKKIKNFFLKFLIKKLYNYSDLIITSGKSVQFYLKKIIKKKIYFFNNPIYFKNDYNKKNFKENSWLKYNKFNYILAVGRFHEQKNYNFLINSYALLKNPKYKLAIIGDGNQKKKF